MSDINDLPQGAGKNGALKPKGNFERSPHQEWTYFIRDAEGIKIGRSIHPRSRLKDLQAGNGSRLELLVAVPSSQLSEGEAHRKFKHLRTHREWFRPEQELLDFIASLKAEKAGTKRPARIDRREPVIRKLVDLRKAHGHTTAMGHTCSNLLEQLPAMVNYVRPAWVSHKIQTLPYLIEQQMKRIERLKAASN